MARLVIVTHSFDVFAYQPPDAPPGITSPYLLFDVLQHFKTLGHSWVPTKGPRAVDGDVALLHVDSTVVGEEYLALAEHYPRSLNFGTGDITKRKVSRLVLAKQDSWDGRVIVKANFNCSALSEVVHNRRARRAGSPPPHPDIRPTGNYRVYERLDDVEDAVWDDPALLVERFIPEEDEGGGFVIRTWVFMGPRERCTRMVTPTWIGKAGDAIRYEAIEVPELLRAERERLKFDFGKFDFMMHEGKPVLIDANRTPGTATPVEGLMKSGAQRLAEGLDALVTAAD